MSEIIKKIVAILHDFPEFAGVNGNTIRSRATTLSNSILDFTTERKSSKNKKSIDYNAGVMKIRSKRKSRDILTDKGVTQLTPRSDVK